MKEECSDVATPVHNCATSLGFGRTSRSRIGFAYTIYVYFFDSEYGNTRWAWAYTAELHTLSCGRFGQMVGRNDTCALWNTCNFPITYPYIDIGMSVWEQTNVSKLC